MEKRRRKDRTDALPHIDQFDQAEPRVIGIKKEIDIAVRALRCAPPNRTDKGARYRLRNRRIMVVAPS
ncbi:MAG TPA: hypothetical protein VJ770_18980 [Stellaceae bacterium]|nr:hypothetical protein [Stellaceae bacterium]